VLAEHPGPAGQTDRPRGPDGVTFIHAAGKACLAAMHRQGAEFIAADCLTKALVAEISQEFPAQLPVPEGKREGQPRRNRGAT
jgi:hypothetical protein